MSRPAVRPGRMIKKVLTAGPASTADIHRAYREAIRVENGRRSRKEKLRPMTYESFRKFVNRAKASGLIRIIGSKPMEKTPNPLVGQRGMRVLETQEQTVYALTTDGKDEVGGWENLQAYAAGLEVAEPKMKRRKKTTPAPVAAPKAVPAGKSKVAPARFDTTSPGAKKAAQLKAAAAPTEQPAKKTKPKPKAKKG
jgi:hypothetical protein